MTCPACHGTNKVRRIYTVNGERVEGKRTVPCNNCNVRVTTYGSNVPTKESKGSST